MKAVKLPYTHERMMELLNLPVDTIILGFFHEFQTGIIEILVSHPNLDDMREGCRFIRITDDEFRQQVEP